MESVPSSSDKGMIAREGGAERIRIYDRKHLINTLNFLHFQNLPVLVNLRRRHGDDLVSIPASPQPCFEAHLDCLWTHPERDRYDWPSLKFESLLVPDGCRVLVVQAEAATISERGLCILLPETCPTFENRRARRYPGAGIRASIIQNSVFFSATLEDFSTSAFRLRADLSPPQTFRWINTELPVSVQLHKDGEMILSADCRIGRQSKGERERFLVLEPLHRTASRFTSKKYRSPRLELTPSPVVSFHHPLSGKLISLGSTDISGTGLAVEEDIGISTLLPGMVIPDLEICFARNFSIRCLAQVVYRRISDSGETARCGIAFLDMAPDDHVKLQSLLLQTHDKNTFFCHPVNLDELWRLFFDTGFLYPAKYQRMLSRKEEVKSLFKKLYTECPKIARHVIYQDQGTVQGHLSMIRFYSSSWLIHHHAAMKHKTARAGLKVLAQIGRSIRDSQTLFSSRMNYVIAYFRPENRFPSRVFGGVAQHYDDRENCSIDTFAYIDLDESLPAVLPSPWSLAASTRQDLSEAGHFYARVSGGLLIEALDLAPEMADDDEIIRDFTASGLKRERYHFSLYCDGRLKALFLLNISDFGLNFSHLTSSVQALVLDPGIPGDVFKAAIGSIFAVKCVENMPVLVFPETYPASKGIVPSKNYMLWILNCQNLDPYFKFIESNFNQV